MSAADGQAGPAASLGRDRSQPLRLRMVYAFVGICLGVVLAEGGARLYFEKYEWDRTYWGPGSHVPDARTGLWVTPGATLRVGREGAFGPQRLTVNSLGYRDGPEPTTRSAGELRIVLAGDSYMFGLGVDEARREMLFHARLQRALQDALGDSRHVRVLNCSQPGFQLEDVCYIALTEAVRLDADFVVVSVTAGQLAMGGMGRRPPYATLVDSVNGYLLPHDRFSAGTFVDELRTRSALVMRALGSPLIRRMPALRGLGLIERLLSGGGSGGLPVAQAAERVDELADDLGGTPVAAMVVHGRKRYVKLADALRARGVPVVDLLVARTFMHPGDDHWTEAGHAEAAEIVAPQLVPLLRKALAGDARP